MPELLECGRIINTHGVRGELKIDPWCDGPEFFEEIPALYIEGTAYPLLQSRPHKQFLLVKLEGVTTLEQAEALKNKLVFFDKEQVSLPEDEYYIADILGFEVFDNRTQAVLGVLKDFQEMPSSDLYVIQGENNEILIPAVDEFMDHIDFESRRIFLNTIQGMLPHED
ncbi:ribosome maturation factor RimM [Acidaminobacterium chupaoyuni]